MNSDVRDLRFLLTDRCNLRCQYCHNEFQGDLRPGRDSPWDVDAVSRLVSTARANGVTRTKFSGGEPLLQWHWLIRLMNVCRRRGIGTFTVFSNLTRATPDRLRCLRKGGVDRLNVNLPSFRSPVFQSRTDQDVWPLATVLQNAAHARKLGINVQFNLVVPADFDQAQLRDFVTTELHESQRRLGAWDSLSLVVDDWGTDTLQAQQQLAELVAGVVGTASAEDGPARSVLFDTPSRPVLVSRCTIWGTPAEDAEADIYVIPPGSVLTSYIKGRAYRYQPMARLAPRGTTI